MHLQRSLKNNNLLFTLRSKLRIKVTLGIVLPLITILGIFTAIDYYRHRSVLLSNLALFSSYSAEVVEDNLLHQMLEADFVGVQELINTIAGRDEFSSIYILDPSGEIIFAPGEEGKGQYLNNESSDCQPCHRLSAAERPKNIIIENENGEQVFRSMHPLENSPACAECHDTDERLIGLILTDMSMKPLMAPLAADLRENLMWWAVTILAVAVVVNIVMSNFVLQPLEGLLSTITGFGKGTMPRTAVAEKPDEIGRLRNAFDEMAQRIERRRRENQALSSRLQEQSNQRGELLKRLITAQEDERKRVARELHDELGQTLSGLSLRLEGVRRLLDADRERALVQLNEVQSLAAASTEQMYEIILDLRPSVLDDLGLVPALRVFAERLQHQNGIHYSLEVDEIKHRLPPELETALFRIYQEALNNSIRHGRATDVHISLTCQANVFSGEIRDNGRGFDLNSIKLNGNNHRGLGLLGMQERAIQCGGELEVRTKPGEGTQILIKIPIPEVICD